MTQPLLIILMGSKSDLTHCEKIATAAQEFDLDTVMRVSSAHKTPAHLLETLREYEADPRSKVYMTVAGRSNALSGFVDGFVQSPVIACPPPSDAFGGADIYSSLRMPSGIAPAFVLDPANAALLAAKILGLHNAEVRAKVDAFRIDKREQLLSADASITASGSD